MNYCKLSADELSIVAGMAGSYSDTFPDYVAEDDPRRLAFLGLDAAGIANAQKQKIREAFAIAEVLPVDVPTIGTFNGGWDSAARLYNGLKLAEVYGWTEQTFFDTSNIAHVLDLATCLEVCKAVGYRFMQDFGKKQSLMVAIDAVVADGNLTDAEKIIAIQSIVW